MKKINLILVFILFTTGIAFGQKKHKKLQFYGGFSLGISTGYTYVSLQPGVLYNFNDYVKSGVGIQYSYIKSNKNYYGVNYSRNILGFNLLALGYPVKQMELLAEFEDVYVMNNYNTAKKNFWSPALFGGIGYKYEHLVFGFKFNFLHKNGESIYQDAFIPYVRFYF
jgi:hypothetical protein